MKNISVLGFYNKDNVGDETYKIVIPRMFPGHSFTFSSHVDEKADCLILGGGNVCSDEFLKKTENFKGPKYAISVSVVKSDPVEKLAKFNKILVRTRNSVDYLASKGIFSIFCPDAAFMLQPDVENGKKIIDEYMVKNHVDKYDKKIVVVLNAYLLGQQEWLARDYLTFEKVVWSLGSVLDNIPANFIFVPFCTRAPVDDRVTNAWLSARCKWFGKNLVIYDNLGPQGTLDVISASDAVISSRLHSSIFSCIANKPFVDLTHHDKNLQFLQTIYRKEWSVSYWHFDVDKVSNLLRRFLKGEVTGLESIRDDNYSFLSKIKQYVNLI